MLPFAAGLLCGLIVAAPLLVLVSRRTERRVRNLEKRTHAAEQLAELVTLTGGLAHEIKNPLSTIGLNLQLLKESIDDSQLPDPDAARLARRIDALTSETNRLRAILEDFLSFAGRVRISTQLSDLNELVEQLVDFYNPQAAADQIKLRTQLDPRAGALQLDPTLFKQALLNLLINATQAMVEARYSDRSHGGCDELIIQTKPTPDGVEIHVTDTGPGIDDETRRKIFRPYFTTKHKGTGLGLSTTRRIVNEHGGTLSVHSEVGRGSNFIIYLPRTIPDR